MSSSAFWNERYGENSFAYGTTPNSFLTTQTHLVPPSSKILCLAEGEGRNAVYLATLGHSVTGVDSSSIGLQKANELASSKGVAIETHVVDLADYDIGESKWDVVVSIFCHLPPPLRKDVHERVAHGLKPGGVLILEAYNPKQLEMKTGGPHSEAMLMRIDDLRSDFEGMDIEIGREVERDVVEGKYHTGKSAVVQVVARKPDA
mmetsp:Transcript_22507/g.48868  ORF Transcript_22507/g.48868 Transcript_22507/m.48868 type:complete len:204 (-) Transcript_22507:201-812(-)